MIEAKGVSLRYPNGTIGLKEVNLELNPGELIYITGPSGSGKTSLLKLIMGVEYPTTGSLKVLGQEIKKDQTAGIRHLRMKLGSVFQEFRLIKGRTVMENVMLGMRFLDFSQGELKENVDFALEKVGLKHKAYALVENLSWGECQRVAIARAVARKPVLILADEPTGNLDQDNALKILELLTSFKDENTTVMITTHATHLIDSKKASRLLQVNEGSIIENTGA
ncbi:MAG: cell division ATP-binding protein FtsE [Bacillota bacterium]|jgi:cell division transport system ATP-binding protein